MGCDSIRFRIVEDCSDDNPEAGPRDRIYPDDPQSGRQPEDLPEFPDDVRQMYQETIRCFNAGALTMAGDGLRAIVEAICQDRKVTGAPLANMIDELVKQGYLVKAQADLLHEERYIGISLCMR